MFVIFETHLTMFLLFARSVLAFFLCFSAEKTCRSSRSATASTDSNFSSLSIALACSSGSDRSEKFGDTGVNSASFEDECGSG